MTAAHPPSGSLSPVLPASRNEVVLVGRVADRAQIRPLPSGDVLASFRLIVSRPADSSRRSRVRQPSVDAIDCVAWRADLRRTVAAWQIGDTVEVKGSLRRRFWRGPGGAPSSRSEVEVFRGRRLLRAAGTATQRRSSSRVSGLV